MNIIQTPENSSLGHATTYPTTYSPHILYPIPRRLGRNKLTLPAEKLSIGMDWWHVFELSWLNSFGISQVAMARLTIPATSEYIIESKSLKLYFNSLNFTKFDSQHSLQTTIENDLSACLKVDIKIEIFEIIAAQSLPISEPQGICIDKNSGLEEQLRRLNEPLKLVHAVDNRWLVPINAKDESYQLQIYHSHLLRSNCPVTNQPDWGTVEIQIECPTINTAGLLRYILTYRQHNGFHEQCVEQIFNDLTMAFRPLKLLVRAWYTRRGGIDINPCRVSDLSLLPQPSRLNRQ